MDSNALLSYERLRLQENKIVWNINNLCNFKCEYCFFPYFEKEGPDVAKYSNAQIRDAFNSTGRQWHLYISGGEPLLYPDFSGLVNLLKPQHPIQISTNLFNRKVNDFVREVSPENISMINASLHIGHHNEKSLIKFIRNYHAFREKGFNILVSYVTFPPLFNRIENDFAFLESQGVRHIHPLTYQGVYEGRRYPGSYTANQLKTIRKLTLEPMEMVLASNEMNFLNRSCKAGMNYFFMDVKGDLYKCNTIREFSGNLFQGTFSPNTEPALCTAAKCNDSCFGITSLVIPPEPPVSIENSIASDTFMSRVNRHREMLS